MNEQEAPVNAGEIFEVSINAIGGKGDGIAKVKGFVLFVPNVQKGDYVKIRVTKVLQNAGFAEVVEKLEKPVREKRFETTTRQELEAEQYKPDQHYDDTEDFGEELKE